jgi:hypothetical protein
MRLWAAAAAFLILSCGPSSVRVFPEFRVVWTTPTGEQLSAENGNIDFAPVTQSCWSDTSIAVQNTGQARGAFRLSAPSTQFVYEQGPFELYSGESVEVPIRLSASGSASIAQHDVCLESEGPITQQAFTLRFPIASNDLEVPHYDFKAVLIGQEASLVAPNVNDLTGDFRKDAAEIFFRPSTTGAQVVTADYTYQTNCEPGRISIRGDGVSDWVQLLDPATVSFDDTRVGQTAERIVSLDLWLDEELPFEVPQTPAGAPSIAFTAAAVPSATRLMERAGDGVLVPAHREYRVRFTPAAAGPQESYIVLTLRDRELAVPLRGVGLP